MNSHGTNSPNSQKKVALLTICNDAHRMLDSLLGDEQTNDSRSSIYNSFKTTRISGPFLIFGSIMDERLYEILSYLCIFLYYEDLCCFKKDVIKEIGFNSYEIFPFS